MADASHQDVPVISDASPASDRSGRVCGIGGGGEAGVHVTSATVLAEGRLCLFFFFEVDPFYSTGWKGQMTRTLSNQHREEAVE